MVSKTFIPLTIASIKMFFRDRQALFWSLFFPIVIMGIFGLIDFSRFTIDLGIVVAEENKLEFAGIVEGLKQNAAFNVTEGNYADEEAELIDDKRDLILVLNKNDEGVIEAEALINASTQTQSSAIAKEIKDMLESNILNQANVQLPFRFKEQIIDVNDLTPLNFILPGVLGIALMNNSMFGVAGGIVRNRERNALKSLFATPLKKSDFLLSQVITRLVVSMMQVVILFALPISVNRVSGLIQGIPPEEAVFYFKVVGSWFDLFAVAVFGAVVFINFGFMVSALSKTYNQAVSLVNIVATPMMFLSGAFFPKEVLPKFLQSIAGYFPLTFLVDGMREVMNKGAGFVEIEIQLAGLLIWALLIFVLATRLFKWES
ncbi:ABC transporter permease [Candidatus Dojkabacteria bacterium]|nr:ABC transporter permease [Candidatus Dojkabacteria bacterium]